MSEMVERVARVIYEMEPFISAHGHGVAWDAVAVVQKAGFLSKARNVIRAMREPTEAMLEAGDAALIRNNDTSADAWPAMIDVALTGTMIAPDA